MMEWLTDDPNRIETVVGLLALYITAAIVWVGRRRLALSVPCAFVFLLWAVLSLPGLIPARSESQRAACVNNLKWIANAKAEWASKNDKSPTDAPSEADLYGINAFIRDRPQCPRGGTYIIGRVADDPTCSFANKGHRL
jgi:hypothetical protein